MNWIQFLDLKHCMNIWKDGYFFFFICNKILNAKMMKRINSWKLKMTKRKTKMWWHTWSWETNQWPDQPGHPGKILVFVFLPFLNLSLILLWIVFIIIIRPEPLSKLDFYEFNICIDVFKVFFFYFPWLLNTCLDQFSMYIYI